MQTLDLVQQCSTKILLTHALEAADEQTGSEDPAALKVAHGGFALEAFLVVAVVVLSFLQRSKLLPPRDKLIYTLQDCSEGLP